MKGAYLRMGTSCGGTSHWGLDCRGAQPKEKSGRYKNVPSCLNLNSPWQI